MMMAVLEGIYRVVDMDQVVFALIDQKSKTLRAKLMIGQRRESIIKHQPSEVSSGEYLRQLLTKGEADWITRENCKQFRGKNIDPLIVKLGAQEFFVHPILMRDKAIGIIYADRFSSKLRFNKAHFRSFQHLADHASLAFRILSNQN
jgi:transcriptional regulator with GAF, ATPase, and Fis domain